MTEIIPQHLQCIALYTCPFVNRCDCPVKFRVVMTATDVFLYTHGKHTADSHSSENTARQLEESRSRLSLPQQAAVQDVVWPHPMSSSSDVGRSLNLSDSFKLSRNSRLAVSLTSKCAQPSESRLSRHPCALKPLHQNPRPRASQLQRRRRSQHSIS